MNSGELIPSNNDQSEPASAEVQFALVIARMIDSVKNSPADTRQLVYDLARYKLQEQFTYTDAKDIRRTQLALETAIRGVEEFSKQHTGIAPPPVAGRFDVAAPASRILASPASIAQLHTPLHLERDPEPGNFVSRSTHLPWPLLASVAAVIAIFVCLLVAVQQRERFAHVAHHLLQPEAETAPALPPLSAPVANTPAAEPLPAKPAPLRPKDYGVYAIGQDSLTELRLLSGRSPDIRVAISAAIKSPSQTFLPNGHPKFLVFRRDVVSSISDRADVRIMARVAREFSPDAAGKMPSDRDHTWVIRNVAFPFRSTPMDDNPDMYELHSEDPDLELSPGRYALILKNQSYDFSVEGKIVDPRQCIERVIASNGTFYSDCKEP